MAGIELDPRTGEPRRGIPLFLRILLLLVLTCVLAYIILTKFVDRGTDMDVRELAYRSTGLIKTAQWEFRHTHGRFATLPELHRAGLLDAELQEDTAILEFGITARCSLPMDRSDFELTVDYGDGSYRTTANDGRYWNDFSEEVPGDGAS